MQPGSGQDRESLPVVTEKIQYLSGGGLSEPARNWTTGPTRKWKDQLTISRERIEVKVHKGPVIQIEPARVIALTYAGMRRKRYELVALFPVAPVPSLVAPTVAPKSTTHLVQIDFILPDGTASAVLLRAHKSNYDTIVRALSEITGIAEQTQPSPEAGKQD